MHKPSDQELWHQLSNACNLRSSQDQVLWTISGIFWAVNAVLLVALFQGGKLPQCNIPGIVISAVGFMLSAIQFFLQGRALGHIKRYEELIKKIEKALNFDSDYAVSADLNLKEADGYLGGRKGNIIFRLKMCDIPGNFLNCLQGMQIIGRFKTGPHFIQRPGERLHLLS